MNYVHNMNYVYSLTRIQNFASTPFLHFLLGGFVIFFSKSVRELVNPLYQYMLLFSTLNATTERKKKSRKLNIPLLYIHIFIVPK